MMSRHAKKQPRTGIRVLAAACAAIGLAAGGASQIEAAGYIPDTKAPRPMALAKLCNGQAVQAIAASLSAGVTVGKIANQPGPFYADGTRYYPASGDLPAFCQVTGSYVTNPKTGKTANFLATFPENWNGKYLQLGCSGHCGTFAVSNPAMPTITITNQGTPGQIIRKGYAAFATDQGHTEMTGGTWAVEGPGQVDEDAITDFLWRASKVLTQMGKAFTRAFYERETGAPAAISRSYFSGCSGGGRDALVAASYFPEEFDGIVAGSPYNLMGRAFHGAGTTVATLRTPDAAIPKSLLPIFNDAVVAQCDGLDGVKDGLIQNPMACNFRPERDLPKCAGDKPGRQCFTKAQIETVSTVLTAVTDEQGNLVQPGYSVSELLDWFAAPTPARDPAAENPWPDDTMGSGGMWSLAHAALKVFSHKNDPSFSTRAILTYRDGGPGKITDFRTVVPKAEVTRAIAAARLGIGHFPESYKKLIGQNRKLLIWHNLSDEKLTPYMSVNLYKQLAARYGGYEKLQDDVRLFGIPGTAHCSGGGLGVGPGSFDALSAIEDWVEKGKAPDGLLATLYQPTFYGVDFSKPLGRTMPLCKFPEMAKYKGSGDVRDAANWFCPSGDRSMLEMGESGRRAGVID
jgi:feruloyl esterase